MAHEAPVGSSPDELGIVRKGIAMDDSQRGQLTRLLEQASSGNAEALHQLFPLVYQQLRDLARRRMSSERAGHTLQPTALVHEVYVRLLGEQLRWKDSAHFYLAAAEAMRRILIDHARARGANKRGGKHHRIDFNNLLDLADGSHCPEILSLDEAILRLKEISESAAEVVQLRFYAGLSTRDTAKVLGVTVRSIQREWNFARAWLSRELDK